MFFLFFVFVFLGCFFVKKKKKKKEEEYDSWNGKNNWERGKGKGLEELFNSTRGTICG